MRNRLRVSVTALASAAILAVLPVAGTSHASIAGKKIGGVLNVIAWQGYTDPSFTNTFKQQTGCSINATYAGSSDEMFAKFRSGGGTGYDMVSASGDASLRFIQSGAVQPVDVSKVPNWKNLLPALKGPPHNTVNGKHYGVSFMWGPDVLIYNTKYFKKAPTSWSVLYDKKYKGKITIPDNAIQLADVAVYLGYKKPYNLTAAQYSRVVAVAKSQRPLVRHYWAAPGEFEQDFKNGDAILGAGWPLMTVDLKKAGMSVAETIPKEGATGWADTWMLSTHSSHTACAYAWMNYALAPTTQAKVVAVTGYSPANVKTAAVLGPSKAKALHITDTKYFNSIKFWKTPPNYPAWQTAWNTVKG
jgi:putative spermidine/putrescine transport system substrate-binding protein